MSLNVELLLLYVVTEFVRGWTVRRIESREECVCDCAQLCKRMCGLVSGDGRVVRYEVSSAQSGSGREHNESD